MVALLQFSTKPSGLNELKCFYEASELNYNSFLAINLTRKYFNFETLKVLLSKSHCVIIGGNSETSYPNSNPNEVENYSNVKSKTKDIVKYLLDIQKPLLGICFGHQIISETLGSQIVSQPQQVEIGFGNINLTLEGQKDPIFAGMKKKFPVFMAHKDCVQSQPKNSLLLASSDRCYLQAIKFGPKSYGIQFHPELLYEDFLIRQKFSPQYKNNLNEVDEPTIINNRKIIRNFLQKISP